LFSVRADRSCAEVHIHRLAMPPSSRMFGRSIMLLGVIAVTPDALCVKHLSDAGADVLCIIAWKMWFASLATALYTLLCPFRPRALLEGMIAAGWYMAPVAFLQGAGNVTFTAALAFTSATNTLLFVNMNVLWTSLLGFLFLHETLPVRTFCALSVAFGSVLVIFVPEIIGEERSEFALVGDAMALVTGACWAMSITVIRRAASSAPGAKFSAPLAVGLALGGLACACLQGFDRLLPAAAGFQRPASEFWCVIVAEAMGVTAIEVAMTIAPALIPGPEVSAIMMLENITAPLLMYAVYGDGAAPSKWSLIGGAMLLATLAVHELGPSAWPRTPPGGEQCDGAPQGGAAEEEREHCGKPISDDMSAKQLVIARSLLQWVSEGVLARMCSSRPSTTPAPTPVV